MFLRACRPPTARGLAGRIDFFQYGDKFFQFIVERFRYLFGLVQIAALC